MPSRVLERRRTARAARRGGSSSARAEREPRRARRPRLRGRRAIASTSVSGRCAEERERDVQRLVGDRAPDRRVGGGARNERQRGARRRRQVERDEQPQLHAASIAARRSRCIATVVVRSRTSRGRRGGAPSRSLRSSPAADTHRQTVPTGFSGVPPPGPAIPVIPMPIVGPEARARAVGERRRHLGRDRAVRARSAPRARRRARSWPRWSRRRRPPSTYADEPGAVGQPRPPSARRCTTRRSAIVRPGAAARATCRRSSSRRRRTACRRGARAIAASKRVVARPRPRLEHRRDLELAAAQAGRDLERRSRRRRRRARAACAAISDSGSPNRRRIRCSSVPARASSVAQRRGVERRLPHRLQLARRPGQHDDQRAARPSATHAGPARSRPARARSRRRGTSACLRLPARIASSSRLRQRPRSRSRIAQMRSSSASSSASGRPPNSATTSAVRSSAVGPSPPLVTIRSTPWPARKSQRRAQVLGPVADDHDVRELDARARAAARTATARCGRR